ncbi:MAG: IS21 family transposase, partial [Bacillota bacterium]|nr:IS21 family transposase [Bacillota bacterium]
MIDVDEKELIRRAHFLQGLSMRRIARERRHSRHTVRRALEDPGPPVYRRRQPKPRPVLGPYTAVIDQWLVEDQQRPPKQRHTARRIYHRLVAEYGFAGGESTVRQYVREVGKALGLPPAELDRLAKVSDGGSAKGIREEMARLAH